MARFVFVVVCSALSACLSVDTGSRAGFKKVELLDMVYYSSAMDLYVVEQGQEKHYRIENSQKNFTHTLNLLKDKAIAEGPPEIDQSRIGQMYILQVGENDEFVALCKALSATRQCVTADRVN